MDWKNKKVLVAEDEDTNYLLLLEYLEPTGINIFRAFDGIEALDMVSRINFDIMLIDVKMPRMTGDEAIPLIRKMYPKVPIIVQTAYAGPSDREKIIQIGCNDYISKPIDEENLVNKMSLYLDCNIE
jgi:two-component system, cell cycle response regulator DivK